jgi:hypothetical protein
VVAENVVTFFFESGYPYHTGIVTDVTKDKNGNVTSFTMVDSHSGVGPEERTVTMGVGKLGKGVHGFYKWDSKQDAPGKNTSSSSSGSNFNSLLKTWEKGNTLLRMANVAEGRGLNNASQILRAEATSIFSTMIRK